ncbi:DNA internalization-related competence protein ComEC/Rec2 [Marinospirillum insulare]|uniref:DNA internalization-related competence protein ComEC/Rec2 n=1 Tax=Marinospirillum insulare TaxID=217169 RepID=A0ABQ5ZWY3_9GAMM|nr:DNA internalization-related competence protein ComEC/Rec2 [Marinospirillum insulare]GLR64690.1 DNA internalization-related competence protein ComEC/Rec2 [Marinospirillum insulare]
MKLIAYKFSLLAAGLLVGILSSVYFSDWPPVEALLLLLLASFSLLKRQHFFSGALLFGFCWLLIFLAWQMQAAPSTTQAANDNSPLLGKISPSYGNAIQLHTTRLNWYAKTSEGKDQALPQQGETWQLEARLRPLRSLQNFGQADSTGRKLAAGQVAGGYIPRKAQVKRLKQASPLNQWRNQLINQIEEQSTEVQRGWRFLVALGLGAKQLLTQEDWQLLQKTGTLHLWIVSGLHLGLLAGLVLWLANKYHWPQALALPLAAALALGYAQLAGWGLAAERAALMLLLGLLIISGWRKLGVWLAFSLALIILLLANPLIVLSKGFWLSFGAVAILIGGFYGRVNQQGLSSSPLMVLFKVQVLLLLAFTPLLIWQGAWFNLASLPINLVLVPLVGLVLLPGSLLALMLQALGMELPLNILASLFNLVALGLEAAAKLNYFTSQQLQNPAYLWLGLLALLPPGIAIRHFAWLGLVLAFLPSKPATSNPEQWEVKVLDVGQGTAVLVESAGEKLLYDTGRGFSSGWAAVLPALEPWLTPSQAPQGLNQVVISHDDQDHSGGLPAIKKRWQVQQEYSAQQANCYAGQSWQLGALEVMALWPPQPPLNKSKTRADNEDSCVLLIKAPEHQGKLTSLLLTGDAGLAEEAFFSQALAQLLTNQQGEQQPLTLLITGHHGSKTSTGLPLLQATKPQYAIHTNGWRNSYGHPHLSVVQRLREFNAQQLSTAAHGAIHFEINKGEVKMQYKNQKPPLWHWLGYKP